MILLDTNAVIALMTERPRQVRLRLKESLAAGQTIGISSIVLFELHFGNAQSRHRAENSERLRRLMAGRIEAIGFDEADALVAGEVRAALAAVGRPIGPYDVLIAAQALRHGATLVTANTREIARVPGLKVENWAGE